MQGRRPEKSIARACKTPDRTRLFLRSPGGVGKRPATPTDQTRKCNSSRWNAWSDKFTLLRTETQTICSATLK